MVKTLSSVFSPINPNKPKTNPINIETNMIDKPSIIRFKNLLPLDATSYSLSALFKRFTIDSLDFLFACPPILYPHDPQKFASSSILLPQLLQKFIHPPQLSINKDLKRY